MVKYLAPAILVLLASCGTVSGRPPEGDQYNPQGAREETLQAPPDESISAESFPLFPDDEIRIAVLGQPDLTLEVKVPAEGTLHYPMIGEVQVANRTLNQVREDIKARLEKDYLVAPAQVSVQVRAYAPKRAYVLGAVGRAGEVEIPGGRFATLLQTVSSAGGFAEDASLYSVLIYRGKEIGSNQRIPYAVDVVALQQGRGRDPIVLPNDVILVPARERVYVHGSVGHPGGFVVKAGQKLLATQAIAMAGGCTRVANDSNVRLSRVMKDGKRQNFVLDLSRVTSGNVEEDVPLQPGDTLFVPESVF